MGVVLPTGDYYESRYLVELYPGDCFLKDGHHYIFFRDENKGLLGGVNLNDGSVFWDDKVTMVELVGYYEPNGD